jgi:hypothetical protein
MRAASFCESLTKNPVTIRVATNAVLMISDLDVVFSFLFMSELWKLGGIYRYFLFVVIVGMISYLVGVTYFGPQQKYKTMDLVLKMMDTHPNQFKPRHGPRLTPMSRSNKDNQYSKQFKDLESTKDGMVAFKSGLTQQDLQHLWVYVESKNARNCCEWSHGIPFLRLSAYGFFSEPSPNDLGSILNANALYTFTTGIPQIAVGVMMLSEGEPSMNSLLPLFVSTFSLVLSLINIFMDFAAVLNELNEERRIKESIQTESEAEQTVKREELNEKTRKRLEQEERRHNAEVAIIEQDVTLGGAAKRERLGRAKLLRNDNVAQINRDNLLQLNDINDVIIDKLQQEIMAFRRKLQAVKQIMEGKDLYRDVKQPKGAMEKVLQRRESLQNQIDKIDAQFQKKLAELDIEQNDADTIQAEMQKLTSERDSKVKLFEAQIEAVTNPAAARV